MPALFSLLFPFFLRVLWGKECSQLTLNGKMNVLTIDSFNAEDPFSTLSVKEYRIPQPKANEVLVEMMYMPINVEDYNSILGLYPGFQPETFPAVAGLEGVGRIVKLGPGAENTRFSVLGTIVIVLKALSPGTYAEYVVCNAEDGIIGIGHGEDPTEIAQVGLSALTADALIRFDNKDLDFPQEDAWLLQNAGGSGVGRVLIQLAKKLKHNLISIVRRCDQVEELKTEYGATHVFCESDDWVAEVKKLTPRGRGVHKAFDAVAGAMTSKLQTAVQSGGKVVVYGRLGGFTTSIDLVETTFRNVAVDGFWINNWLSEMLPSEYRWHVEDLYYQLSAGEFSTQGVGKTFSLEEFKEAFQEATSVGRSSRGKAMFKAELCPEFLHPDGSIEDGTGNFRYPEEKEEL